MKVLYVDTTTGGHHVPYLKALTMNADYEIVITLPEIIHDIDFKQIKTYINLKNRNLIKYFEWIKEIQSIAEKESPDIIHFLYGDIFYRYFGMGLEEFKKYKTIITFHQIKKGFLRDISIKRIFKNINIGIVHPSTLSDQLNKIGIKNVKQIENSHYFDFKNITKESALEHLNLTDKPLLLAIGGTRFDKGLDILLEALKYVNKPFQLLIAGEEQHFKRDYIERNIESYKNNVKLMLRNLYNVEFYICINAADIIVLPYRKIFTGASGPLGEGVWQRKTIIGPSHGGLGETIRKNNIGSTFNSEDTEDLANVINEQLENKHKWNEISEKYRLTLSTEIFAAKHKSLYDSLNY